MKRPSRSTSRPPTGRHRQLHRAPPAHRRQSGPARAARDQPRPLAPGAARARHALSWALQAVGDAAIPALRGLYTEPEAAPRLAALRAGAALGDALATPHLQELADAGPPSIRGEAVKLLGSLGPDPKVNLALRELLHARDVDIRVAALEALIERRDPTVRRWSVDDGFILDAAPADDPLLYVGQRGDPRIALLGLSAKIVIRMWSCRSTSWRYVVNVLLCEARLNSPWSSSRATTVMTTTHWRRVAGPLTIWSKIST